MKSMTDILIYTNDKIKELNSKKVEVCKQVEFYKEHEKRHEAENEMVSHNPFTILKNDKLNELLYLISKVEVYRDVRNFIEKE